MGDKATTSKNKRRGHNEGSIYRRKDGRWVAVLTVGGLKRKSYYGRTRPEVQAKLTAASGDGRIFHERPGVTNCATAPDSVRHGYMGLTAATARSAGSRKPGLAGPSGSSSAIRTSSSSRRPSDSVRSLSSRPTTSRPR